MTDEITHPYAEAAPIYFAAGWAGALPIKGKWPPPEGWTGTNGATPSYADIQAWIDGPEGKLNIGLRLPRHVIGIDVDNYASKTGEATLEAAEGKYGPLPKTWITTSRDDGISGIRLYAVPEGLWWPGELKGGSVEIIQYKHRYAMVWPSVHPETGQVYEWTEPDGTTCGPVPHVDELPNLPDAWIEGLTQGRTSVDVVKADLGDSQAATWLAEHGLGAQCVATKRAMDRCVGELLTAGASRHDVAMRGIARVCHLVTEGHQGAMDALGRISQAFTKATGNDSKRGGEWGRLITGAVQIAAVSECEQHDPCLSKFTPPNAFSKEPTTWTAANPAYPTSQPGSSAPTALTPLGSSASPIAAPTPSSASSIDVTQPAGITTALAVVTALPVDAPPRTSWYPIDLTPILTGERTEQPPVVLRRQDGAALFYLGRVNGLIGPSESGKSWVALMGVAQELEDGQHVTYLDFEDTASSIVKRLIGLGIDPESIAERFHYIGPDETPAPEALGDLTSSLNEHSPRMVVLDGVNAAMTLSGLDLMSNKDATLFYQGLLKPIVREDRAIVYVDHTPKTKDDESSGGIGAQAKRAMTSGCAIRVDKKDEFGPGVIGRLKLTIDKDKAGLVREIAGSAKYVGTAVIDSQDGQVTIEIEPPDLTPVEERKPFRPTGLMQRVSDFLGSLEHEAAVSKSAIKKEVEGEDKHLGAAVDRLIEEGFIKHTTGPRGAILCSLIRPFSELTTFTPATPARPLRTPASAGVNSDKLTPASPASTPLRSRGSGRAGVEPDEAATSAHDNTNEENLTWRDGNLVNKYSGEIVRRRV